MHNGMNRMGMALVLAGLAVGGTAHGQTPPRMASGGAAREATYLKLFQEVANLEAEADSLKAQGAQPTLLREYHQKWLRLSPARAAQLKRAALECMTDLKSQGFIADPGAGRPAVRTADGISRSMVRRYVATPVARPTHGGGAHPVDTGPSVRLAATTQRGAALAAQQGCTFCPTPTGENGSEGGSGGVQGSTYGGWFIPGLDSTTVENYYFDGRTVWEEFAGGSEVDGCYIQYPGANIPEVTSPVAGGVWDIQYGLFDQPDYVVDSAGWVEGYMLWLLDHDPTNSCGEHASQ